MILAFDIGPNLAEVLEGALFVVMILGFWYLVSRR